MSVPFVIITTFNASMEKLFYSYQVANKSVVTSKMFSVYDQEIPQSNTAELHTAMLGRDTEHLQSHRHQEVN